MFYKLIKYSLLSLVPNKTRSSKLRLATLSKEKDLSVLEFIIYALYLGHSSSLALF